MNSKRSKKINQALNFLEELGWILDSKKSVSLKELPLLIREELNSNIDHSITRKYSSENQNKNILVGILPNLLLDEELFRTNHDIGGFSKEILQINISRLDKRSRFEIIGLIVCEVPSLTKAELERLVDSLSEITGNTEKLKRIKAEKKKVNFSWNETIQRLNEM